MTFLFVVINQKTRFILLQELFNHFLIYSNKSIKNNSTVWRVWKFYRCFAKKFILKTGKEPFNSHSKELPQTSAQREQNISFISVVE